MGEEDQKRYIKITKIGIIFCVRLATFGMTTFHLRFPYLETLDWAEKNQPGTKSVAYYKQSLITEEKVL